MKTFTINDIRSWSPCYDPVKHLSEDWKGTAADILNNKNIPFADRLWVVLRTELVSERTMRLFAVWCYRDTLNWVKNPDPRSVEAANVAERFANGEVTREQLDTAESAAASARYAAASAAASAASSAASSAARYAARYAAASAAESAAASARYAAASAAAAASARYAAQNRHKEKLLEMLFSEAK